MRRINALEKLSRREGWNRRVRLIRKSIQALGEVSEQRPRQRWPEEEGRKGGL